MGKSNGEIAALLGLSLDTVKEHVQGLFHKLKVNGRAQAVSRGHMLAYLG
jgi:ATP/maltotriose-dependent transcriptional regulator MalT